MAQIPRDLTPGRSALDLFGAELRHWRGLRELSQGGLAELTHYSADLICKVEKAQRWPQREFTEACDAALDTAGALARIWPLVETERLSQAAGHADSPSAGFVLPKAVAPSGFTGAFLPHTGRSARATARTRPWTVRRPAAPARSGAPTPGAPAWPGGGPPSLEEQLLMAAHESAEFTDHPSNVGPATLEQLRADTTRLARSFANAPRLAVFTQTRWLRDRVFALLDGRQRLGESRDLYFLAGAACGMLAEITEDLGYLDAAMAHARTGLLCAAEAGHPGLAAWIRCEQSMIAYYDGRPAHAVEFARRGQERSSPGTVSVWLPALEARAASRLGDAEATRAALARTAEARDRAAADDLDDLGGILSFPLPKQHHYGAESYLNIGDSPATVDAATACVTGYQNGPPADRAHDNEASSQVNLAQALVADDVEAAQDAVRPAFGLAPELRGSSVRQRFQQLHARLSAPYLAHAPVAAELRDQIEDFLATTPTALPPA